MPKTSKQNIGGRISHIYQSWQNITNDPWVLDTVVGYKIEFLEFPHQSYIYIPGTVSTSGKTALLDTSSLSSTPALPLYFDGQNNGFEENSKLQIHTIFESGSPRRTPVVERSLSCMERQIPLEKERRSVDRDQCLQPSLGCVLQWGKKRGNLVSSGMPSAHKRWEIVHKNPFAKTEPHSK